NPASRVYLFPDATSKPLGITLQSFGATDATVRLKLPQGWKAKPESIPVKFAGKGDEARVSFDVTPTAAESTGNAIVEVALANGKKLSYALTNIDYPHIPAQRIFGNAAAKLVRADVKKRGTRIGYIMGAGDAVPDALRQIGDEVHLLPAAG